MSKFSEEDKNKFFIMVDSLKKCRRADLSDINEDDNIIEALYTDPLESNWVLKSCLMPNTAILIGRKGTGKSTIIARIQHEIRKSDDKLSLYLDVKTIFEQAKTFQLESKEYSNFLSGEELQKYLLFKNFLREIIKQIKEEVKTNTIKYFITRISAVFGQEKNFNEQLNAIFEYINTNEYEDISIIKEKLVSAIESKAKSSEKSYKGAAKADLSPPQLGVNVELNNSIKTLQSEDIETKFSEILLQYFNPKSILINIKALLQKIGIKYVFICLDDFSEIDEQAMRIFVDTIVAPLNNWSEEYFKFKIAGYPGRVYLGNIDPTKIETIKLDYYDLYLSSKSRDIETEAIRNVERLITQRCKYFCGKNPDYFFDTSRIDMPTYYKYLFDITANVPRNIGTILWYANQYGISRDMHITIKDLELSAEKFFVDSIDVFFSQNIYMRESFDEKFEKYHLKELLDKIIKQAKKNKTEINISEAKIFEGEKPFTSHFYIEKVLENILSTLELNFFVTKYNEQKDQDGNLMTFYYLNFGLCQKEDIIFGKGKDRKYIIQRRFNYSDIIKHYVQTAKQIKCKNCGFVYPFELLNNLKLFNMLCPTCKKGNCIIEHVKVEIPIVDTEIELPEFDFKILNSLKIDEPQFASILAQELDCYWQTVRSRVTILVSKGLILRKKENREERYGDRTYYYLTDKAKETYFNAQI